MWWCFGNAILISIDFGGQFKRALEKVFYRNLNNLMSIKKNMAVPFLPSSQCLKILMKCSSSCLICYFSSTLVIIISSEDEDPGAEGGDEYEEGQESDSDIDEDDLWVCPQCNLKNHPLSRQCARCWVERHEWLPHLKRSVYTSTSCFIKANTL